MAADISTIKSGLPTDYYAPNFKIEVEGRELDPESKGDVLDVKVVMDLENLTSFDFTINNWDDKGIFFKYSDTSEFDVGRGVHVQMGYADRLLSMVHGQITTLSPKFPESGSPTLAVSGLDSMFKLRDSKPEKGADKYVKMTDWEIAKRVAEDKGLKPQVTEEGPRHDLVMIKNQDYATFLMERAKRIDFDFYVQTNEGKDTLFFVKPKDGRDASKARVYVFEWGVSLINFTPTLTLSNQVGSVTVHGWDPAAKEVVKYTAEPKDLPPSKGGGTSGPQAAQNSNKGKQDVVIDAPVTSQEEARKLAVSLLMERAYEFITGSGQVIGVPDLRPGDTLEIHGLGKRYSGDYYVKKVEHALSSSGYLTNFEVRRTYDGGKK
ncbi:MAG TPA: type IV secretion protein Rhs [Blastocatellia bacterium]|nr:type IV secretion protein Rhs [Blastocatellia bacterium]